MDIVIDTNIVCNSCDNDLCSSHVLTSLFLKDIILLIDSERKLLGEYESNVGSSEFYRKWINSMQSSNNLSYKSVKLDNRVNGELDKLDFTGEVDKIVVALGQFSSSKIIVTDDSDFGKGPRGAEHQDVLDYLTDNLGLIVNDASESIQHII